MSWRSFTEGYLQIPGAQSKTPITLNFTGAYSISVNGYYAIMGNTVSLYIPPFNGYASASDFLRVNLPPNLTPINSTTIIGSVVRAAPSTLNEASGLITISNTGQIIVADDIANDPFIAGYFCGLYNGQTITYNLN